MAKEFNSDDFAEALFNLAATQAQIYRAGIVEGIKIARRQSAAPDRGGNANVIQHADAAAVQVLDANGLRKEAPMGPTAED